MSATFQEGVSIRSEVTIDVDPKFQELTPVFEKMATNIPQPLVEYGYVRQFLVGTRLAERLIHSQNQSGPMYISDRFDSQKPTIERLKAEGIVVPSGTIVFPKRYINVTQPESNILGFMQEKSKIGPPILTEQAIPVSFHEVGHGVYFYLKEHFPKIFDQITQTGRDLIEANSKYFYNILMEEQKMSFEKATYYQNFVAQAPFVYKTPMTRLDGQLRKLFEDFNSELPRNEFVAEMFSVWALERQSLINFATKLEPQYREIYVGESGAITAFDKAFPETERPKDIAGIYKTLDEAKEKLEPKLASAIKESSGAESNLLRQKYKLEFGRKFMA